MPTDDRTPRDHAQDLAWDAMEVWGNDEEVVTLCRRALAIYPDCVDAIRMLADIESQWECDRVDGIRKAIEAGRRELGEIFFRENKGHFWGINETRPFMRAMAALGESLADNQYHLDEAIAVHREMLDLNPSDNQGMRYSLLGCYLARKQYWAAEDLMDRYREASTFFLWGRVLLAYATEGESAALPALRLARRANPHVESYFFPRKQKPMEWIEYYPLGSEDEAIACAQLLNVAWKMHSPARKWLQKVCTSSKP